MFCNFMVLIFLCGNLQIFFFINDSYQFIYMILLNNSNIGQIILYINKLNKGIISCIWWQGRGYCWLISKREGQPFKLVKFWLSLPLTKSEWVTDRSNLIH